jgi:hypothetical protein
MRLKIFTKKNAHSFLSISLIYFSSYLPTSLIVPIFLSCFFFPKVTLKLGEKILLSGKIIEEIMWAFRSLDYEYRAIFKLKRNEEKIINS